MKIIEKFSLLYAIIFIANYQSDRGSIAAESVGSDITTTEFPKFLTRGGTFQAIVGETITLPCQIDNLGNFTVVWKRANTVLSAGEMKITVDPRVHLVDGFNLEIRKVRIHDAGEYICQLSTLVPEDHIYTLEILVPPTVQSEPIQDHVVLMKGEEVTLQCVGKGNPIPIITWRRRNNLLPNGENSVEGNQFSISKADRYSAGFYDCTANNGVGNPVTASIHVKVHYPPEIDLEKAIIYSGDGQEVELVCKVYAEPHAEVKWRLESAEVNTTDRTLTEENYPKYSLIIRLVQPSDFGNYSCVAENKFGVARKTIELTGKPQLPQFLNMSEDPVSDSLNLTWSVESVSPLTEYHISYRIENIPFNDTVSFPSHWTTEIVMANNTFKSSNSSSAASSDPSALGPQINFFQISDLKPGMQYIVRVLVYNKYGASQESETLSFKTIEVPPEELPTTTTVRYIPTVEPLSETTELAEIKSSDFIAVKSVTCACQPDILLIFTTLTVCKMHSSF